MENPIQKTLDGRPWWKRPRVWLASAFVLLLFFGLRRLEITPGMWFDDGFTANVAKSLAEHGVYGIQTAPGTFDATPFWLTTGYPVVLPVAAAFKLFGTSVLAGRAVMVGYMLLTAFMAFIVIRELGRERVAVWSVWLLVTFAPFYGNGKTILGETPGIFWLLVGTWCWIRARNDGRRRIRWTLAAGTALGICIVTKPYFLLLLPAIGITKIWSWIRARRVSLAEECAFGLPLILLVGFWGWHILPKPVAAESFRTVIQFFSNPGGNAITAERMLQNAWRFFSESTPLHLAFLAVIIACSMMWNHMRKRTTEPERIAAMPLVMLGAFVMLALFAYLRTPGWYRYLYPIHLLLLMFMPLALFRLSIPSLSPARKRGFLLLLIVVQLGIAVKNANAYSSTALFLLKDAAAAQVGDRPFFVAHLPEAALILPSDRLSQTIYINDSLTIGENRLLDGSPLPEIVITSTPGDGTPAMDAIEPVLRDNYRLLSTHRRYRIFERNTPTP